MERDANRTRSTIVQAAVRLLRRKDTATPTIEAVAREARCAKGLVNYHFKSKGALLAAAARELGESRTTRWREALSATNANEAITATWEIAAAERQDGTTWAMTRLRSETDRLTVQAVNVQFAKLTEELTAASSGLLAKLGLEPTVPPAELGRLLSAVVVGIGALLETGADVEELRGAYSAAWLGILSLARPQR